jgi:hypothetical protein
MITAIVFSFNDHKYIKECIASLSFVNEVIIVGKIKPSVLSELKLLFPVQFVESNSIDFKQLTEKARKNATYKWMLTLEANHRISKQLSQELVEITSDAQATGAYSTKTRFNFMGNWISFSGYKTNLKPLLFHANKKLTKSKTLIHAVEEIYLDFDSYNKRLTEKAKHKAAVLFSQQKKPNFLHFIWKPLWKMKINFIFKLGFLDGKKGFILAYLKAFEEFKTYLFLWLMYRNLE